MTLDIKAGVGIMHRDVERGSNIWVVHQGFISSRMILGRKLELTHTERDLRSDRSAATCIFSPVLLIFQFRSTRSYKDCLCNAETSAAYHGVFQTVGSNVNGMEYVTSLLSVFDK